MQQGLMAIAAAMALALAAQGALAAEAFECPEISKLGPAAKGELANDLVADPRSLADVGVLTRTVPLFREHDFSDAETVNYLTALFCPVIRADGRLNPAAKSEKVADFTSVVSDIVYRKSR